MVFYRVNLAEGFVILNREKMKENNLSTDSLLTNYKTFPYLFSAETKHKDIKNIRPDNKGFVNPFQPIQ